MTEELNNVETTENELSELLKIRRGSWTSSAPSGLTRSARNMTVPLLRAIFWPNMTDKPRKSWTSWPWRLVWPDALWLSG